MSDRVSIAKRMDTLDISPEINGYSKVIIYIDDDTYVEAGTDDGRILEVTNPFGTQQLANEMLAKLNGYRYEPYIADGAMLDPAAEMGDAVSGFGLYGGIYTRVRQFGKLMKADISAPHDEEIDHEYEYISATDRMYRRELAQAQAELSIQATQIAAKVSADTSENRQSFGWKLTSDSWEVFANNQTVLKATSAGLEVSGKITATSGTIGGFNIGSNAIYNNISSFGDTSKNYGVYIGTNGIQLGKNFRVDSAGNLTASSGTFTGSVRAGSILYGGNNGTFSGSGITGSSIGTGQLNGYCGGGIAGGVAAANVFAGNQTASTIGCTRFILAGRRVGVQYLSYTDGNGNTRSASFLTTQ